MVTEKDKDVLEFFQRNLPAVGTWTFRSVPPGFDDILQEITEPDDLIIAIDKFEDFFNVDVSNLEINNYHPWKRPYFFRKWFTKNPVRQTKKPLTIKMFAESAKAGRWLYD